MLVAVPLVVLGFFLGMWVPALGFLVVFLYPAILMVKSIILYRSIVQSVLLWLAKLGEAKVEVDTSVGQDADGVIVTAVVLNSVEDQLASLGLLEIHRTEAHRWRMLSLGLLLKEGAIWILLALPPVALGIIVVQSPVVELRDRLVALRAQVMLFVGISIALIFPVALLILIIGLRTYGLGFYLGFVAIIPLSFVLGPYLLFVLGLSLQMLYCYDKTLRQIRNRLQIIEAHKGRR